MIARIWKGKTNANNYESYSEFLRSVAVPDYARTEGFKGLRFLREIDGDQAHFTLITYWENLDVIKNFAGEDHTKAKYYPEDDNYLLDFPLRVTHTEVFASQF